MLPRPSSWPENRSGLSPELLVSHVTRLMKPSELVRNRAKGPLKNPGGGGAKTPPRKPEGPSGRSEPQPAANSPISASILTRKGRRCELPQKVTRKYEEAPFRASLSIFVAIGGFTGK